MTHAPSKIVFVLGKGGVGRSTVAAALGLSLARRGQRTLVFEWTLAEAIAPWFGLPPAGTDPVLVAERLSVARYELDEALRAYFVDHLGLGLFHRRIVRGALGRFVDAAPGIAEMLFLGSLFWLSSQAEAEAGLAFDHIVVDAPATGHGASVLDMPTTLGELRASGLLGLEVERIAQMMRDPAWTSVVAVALPEELAVAETLELVPRVARSLGRPPVLAIVNRSVTRFFASPAPAGWLAALGAALPPDEHAALVGLDAELRARARTERELVAALAGLTSDGVLALEDVLVARGDTQPRRIVEACADALAARVEVA
ncbi:MAG: ArsA family ATPase [Polyangiaceae bacterium]|nr:ArsA family ATPase [Polyangiaceae bacterium]